MEKTFELKSFKISLFGVDCKYRIAETDDDGILTENVYHVKVSRPIHPDLESLFSKDLSDIMAEILGDYSADIEPNGVVFSGKDEKMGIIVLAELKTKYGRAIVKSPRIRYKMGDTNVDAQLTVWADKILQETYAYLFENKTAELSVFGE